MSVVVGWIAVEGIKLDRILDSLGLVEAPGAPRPKASICTLPSGWSILLTVDFGFPTPERMTLLSADGTAIAVSADERTMFSVVRGYERGQAVFAIEHDGGRHGVRHIEKAGKVPAEWPAVLDQAKRAQDEEDEGGAEVDHLFDAPVALAEALCGYRHDSPWPEGQQPQTTLLVEKKGPGLFRRLLGG